MRQIRKGTFETNSSSTHSLAIPKDNVKYPKSISFHLGEFGWGWEEEDPADYLYTAICTASETNEEFQERMKFLISALEENNISYTFEAPRWEKDGAYLTKGYIDHSYDLTEFLQEVFSSKEKLLNFVCGGLVFTGNDNCDFEDGFFVNRNKEFLEKEEYNHNTGSWEIEKVKNPYYKPEYDRYDWFEKGN